MCEVVNGKKYPKVPGAYAIGARCRWCREPNDVDNPFVQADKHWGHRDCVALHTAPEAD